MYACTSTVLHHVCMYTDRERERERERERDRERERERERERNIFIEHALCLLFGFMFPCLEITFHRVLHMPLMLPGSALSGSA